MDGQSLERRAVPVRHTGSVAVLLALAAVGCGGDEPPPERIAKIRHAVAAPLPAAHCNITVDGVGTVPMETDYLPHVIQCENGGANLEALKAQAIAARSVAYYAIETDGSICDSQGCQVYSCGGTPNAMQIQAVEETSGLYLSYDALLTYGFYVDGDNLTGPPSCVGNPVGNPGSTREKWITYNDGKTGADVTMTTLGYIPPGQPIFGQNRGCMGQWGARCLENDLGRDYVGILRFYYGADIEILQAPGSCVTPINRPPDGHLDHADCDTIGGWAYDPDDPSTAIDVLVYIDEAPGPSASPIRVTADEHRDDLCTAIGSCAHGFTVPLPASVIDGQPHDIVAYAEDAGGGADVELQQSPRSVQCDPGAAGTGGEAGSSAGTGGATAGAAGTAGTGAGAVGGSGPGGSGTGTGAGPGNQTRVLNQDDGGCGCRAAGQQRSPAPLAFLAALGWLGVLGRRRGTAPRRSASRRTTRS